MKKLIALLVVLMSVGSFAGFGEANSMEAGGRFTMTSIDQGDKDRGYIVEILPKFSYYLMDQFFLGGRFHFTAQEGGSFLGLGMTAGYLFTLDHTVAPYIEGGLEIIHSTWGDSRLGVAIPIEGGIKIPIYKHVSIDVGGDIYIKAIEYGSGTDIGMHSGVSFWIF